MSEVPAKLVETFEAYRREVAPDSTVDARRFAAFFHPMVHFTNELDLATWIRKEGEKRKEKKKQLNAAKKPMTRARLEKELSETRQPKPGERRPIDEVAEEIIYRLMAFKKLLTDKTPGRSIGGCFSDHTGERHSRFYDLATLIFEIYGVEAKPDSILERLLQAKRRAKTEADIEDVIKLYNSEPAEAA